MRAALAARGLSRPLELLSPSAAADGDADSQTDSDDYRELTYVDIDTFEATF